MNFLKYDLRLNKNDVVEVTLDRQANVRLLDKSNYNSYQRGLRHRYYGGLADRSPFRLTAPQPGDWYLVVDLGGYPGSVNASVRTLAPS